MPFKLDHHHRITAQKLFTHPLCHNIQWHDVCSLLGRFGEVYETHRGNWAVSIDGETTRSVHCARATSPRIKS